MSLAYLMGSLGVIAFLFLAPYVVYPLLVRLVPPRRPQGPAPGPARELPRVSVLVPAHNEAEHIGAKLENTLGLDYPRELVEILVCSDGSTDSTDRIVERYGDVGVRLLRNERRSGKTATLGRLVDAARGEILLLTDASASLSSGALAALVEAMADERVGIAAARYVVRDPGPAHGETEAGYWSFESRLRLAEAERDLLVGVAGAAYAIRAELMPRLPEHVVNDDYAIPLIVRSQGHRIAYVPEAVASDSPTREADGLFQRWVRISYGNWQMFRLYRRIFLRGGRLLLPMTRKVLRTSGPLLLLAGFVVVVAALSHVESIGSMAYVGALAVAGGVGVLGLPSWELGHGRIARLVRFCALAQVAYLLGFVRFLTGRREGLWRRGPARPGIDLTRPARPPLSVRFVKRTLDILLASVGLVVATPVLVVTAIAIKLESRGPVFYVQRRLRPGPYGEPTTFPMIKLRSMRADAEKGTGPVWAKQDDDRVTRVGRFIRKHRIDEIPQLLNVLLGQMSVVGPRPERAFIAEQFEEKIPGYSDRHVVQQPGITGWAQVQCGYDTSVEQLRDKVAHDLTYLAHLYSVPAYLKTELRVLRRTLSVVITGRGAQ